MYISSSNSLKCSHTWTDFLTNASCAFKTTIVHKRLKFYSWGDQLVMFALNCWCRATKGGLCPNWKVCAVSNHLLSPSTCSIRNASHSGKGLCDDINTPFTSSNGSREVGLCLCITKISDTQKSWDFYTEHAHPHHLGSTINIWSLPAVSHMHLSIHVSMLYLSGFQSKLQTSEWCTYH